MIDDQTAAVISANGWEHCFEIQLVPHVTRGVHIHIAWAQGKGGSSGKGSNGGGWRWATDGHSIFGKGDISDISLGSPSGWCSMVLDSLEPDSEIGYLIN